MWVRAPPPRAEGCGALPRAASAPPHPGGPIQTPSLPASARFRTLTQELGDNDDEGPLTPSFLVDADKVIDLLHTAIASEHVSWLTYTAHAAEMEGLRAEPATREFRAHAAQELEHMKQLMRRLQVLGGTIDLQPHHLAERSIHTYAAPGTLDDMLEAQLAAERRAVEFYRDAVQWLGDRDPTTRRVLEDILAAEEQHAHDLQGLTNHI